MKKGEHKTVTGRGWRGKNFFSSRSLVDFSLTALIPRCWLPSKISRSVVKMILLNRIPFGRYVPLHWKVLVHRISEIFGFIRPKKQDVILSSMSNGKFISKWILTPVIQRNQSILSPIFVGQPFSKQQYLIVTTRSCDAHNGLINTRISFLNASS